MDPALRELVLEGKAVRHDHDETVDVCVVGTGCGGAVVGKELAQAGKRVLFVERGGLFLKDRGEFNQREDDMLARIDGGRGLHQTADGQILLSYGSCVGGASVHYWADTWRTPKDRSDRWESEHGLEGHSHDELLPYFERIEKDLNVHPATDDRFNRMNQLFDVGAKKAGFTVERVLQARKNCIGSGYCAQGCAYDAKQSQLVTYLPAALAAGARIFADCSAEQVLVENGRAVGLSCAFIDRRTGRPSGHRLRVRAKAVVVAAGGFNSAPLLLRSKVPDPSGQLGKNLMLNPTAQTLALFEQDVVMWQNIPAATGVLDFRLARDEGGRYVEGGYLLHPTQLQPATLAAIMCGFGAEHRLWMERAPRVGGCIGWIDDAEAGEISLDRHGEPVWHYTLGTRGRQMTVDLLRKSTLVLLHAGATEVLLPDGTRVRGLDELDRVAQVDLRPARTVLASPHPSSACRMGKDPARSVVSNTGEHHAVKGLWVCDSSVFPTAVSVDPSETIMAFSYVAAQHLKAAL